jgi:hypothetical protein
MLRRLAVVRTDVSEEVSASETSVLTRATRRNIPEDTILHIHRRENLKSYENIHINSKAVFAYTSTVIYCPFYTVTAVNIRSACTHIACIIHNLWKQTMLNA